MFVREWDKKTPFLFLFCIFKELIEFLYLCTFFYSLVKSCACFRQHFASLIPLILQAAACGKPCAPMWSLTIFNGVLRGQRQVSLERNFELEVH